MLEKMNWKKMERSQKERTSCEGKFKVQKNFKKKENTKKKGEGDKDELHSKLNSKLLRMILLKKIEKKEKLEGNNFFQN